jgi:hypothetical protein
MIETNLVGWHPDQLVILVIPNVSCLDSFFRLRFWKEIINIRNKILHIICNFLLLCSVKSIFKNKTDNANSVLFDF